ncbi:MAG: glycosyltransferase, partial [Lentisphaeria bacterium]|nr:glycosyltransferase [Lentisphaeria bacterium]
QSILPALWVIVDDGSTDRTPEILASYADRFEWIQIIRRDDRGDRAVGPGVIDAFYAGYDTINSTDFDFICKFDLDLDIPETYFAELMTRMAANPRLGTCSGKPYYVDEKSGKLISEKCGNEMSVGMTKFYRTDCFIEMGGFVREVMWDGIDCHRCRMLGWLACSWDSPELQFIHLRPMGSSQQGIMTGRMRHGYGQYYMGTGLLFMMASAAFRMSRPPLISGGLAMLFGYLRSYYRREERYNDLKFRRFLRAYQWHCLLHGKQRTMEAYHNDLRK